MRALGDHVIPVASYVLFFFVLLCGRERRIRLAARGRPVEVLEGLVRRGHRGVDEGADQRVLDDVVDLRGDVLVLAMRRIYSARNG